MPDQITCGECGKTYAWKAGLAGRKVKCRCGHVMTMPEMDEPDPLEIETPEPPAMQTCPQCNASLGAKAVLCTQCGYDLRSGTKTTIRKDSKLDDEELRRRDQEAMQRQHLLKERLVPLGLIGAAIVTFGGVIAAYGGVEALATTWLGLGMNVAVGVGLMLVACFLTAKMLGVSFGPLGSAVLKLAAIYLFPDAVDLGVYAVTDLSFIGWITSIVLYFVLLSWLFDLDFGETMICAVVIFMVQMVAGFVVTMIVIP